MTRPGRKPTGADARLHIRVTPERHAAWTEAAARDGRTLSNWVTVVLDDAAGARGGATMRKIAMAEITMGGQDAQGRFATATIDGEDVGVSLLGEDEPLRSLDALRPGAKVEVGAEAMVVTE